MLTILLVGLLASQGCAGIASATPPLIVATATETVTPTAIATPQPTSTEAAVLSTQLATAEISNSQPPKNEMASYRDANFGFSFTHPANWAVDSPAKKDYGNIPEHGYIVSIRNFNNVVAKRDLNLDEIKIDVWLFPKPENYSTLEAWITTQTLFAPETTYSKLDRLSVGDKQIITWTATGPTLPQGARLYALEQHKSIYLVVGYPSTSLYISSMDELVKSLK